MMTLHWILSLAKVRPSSQKTRFLYLINNQFLYSFKSNYRGNLKDVINVIMKYSIVLYHGWSIIINISISIFIIRFLIRGLFVFGNVRHKMFIHFDIFSAIKVHIKVALLSDEWIRYNVHVIVQSQHGTIKEKFPQTVQIYRFILFLLHRPHSNYRWKIWRLNYELGLCLISVRFYYE